MKQEKIFTGKTVAAALSEAIELLGISSDKLVCEVLEKERTGFLGIGATPAKIKVVYDLPDEKPTAATPEPAVVEPTAHESAAPEAPAAAQTEPTVGTAAAETPAPVQSSEQTPRPPKNNRRKPRSASKPKPESKPAESVEVTDEPLEDDDKPGRTCGDHIAKAFIETLVRDLELDAQVTMTRTRKSDRAISVNGEAAGVLIGHHGDTLDALQYLANLAANKREEDTSRDYVHITVDVENYRAKREAALRSLAIRMANKVKKTEKPVMLEPMSPYERRIIHSEIQNIEGVSTNSVGTDANRRVVVFLESAGFSLPAGVRADKLDRPARSDKRRSDRRRGDRNDRHERSDRRAPAKPQPLYNDGERMSAEEVNELVATYGTREVKEEKKDQPAKFKSFEDYMNSILGEDK